MCNDDRQMIHTQPHTKQLYKAATHQPTTQQVTGHLTSFTLNSTLLPISTESSNQFTPTNEPFIPMADTAEQHQCKQFTSVLTINWNNTHTDVVVTCYQKWVNKS